MREPPQGLAHQLGAFAAQHFALWVVAVAGQQCRGSDRSFAVLVACTSAGPFERLPTHELAAAQLIDAGVARNAEQPGLDFQGNGWASIPRALSFLPGR